jgi:hypothetical protein
MLLFTSSSRFSSRKSRVHTAEASEVLGGGVNSTSQSRLPWMKASKFVASRLPAG